MFRKKPSIHSFNKTKAIPYLRKELGIRGFKYETHLLVLYVYFTATLMISDTPKMYSL
jgi:hypothetical protein